MPKVGSKVQAGLASICPSYFLRVISGLDDKQEKIAVLGSCGIITRNSCSKPESSPTLRCNKLHWAANTKVSQHRKND